MCRVYYVWPAWCVRPVVPVVSVVSVVSVLYVVSALYVLFGVLGVVRVVGVAGEDCGAGGVRVVGGNGSLQFIPSIVRCSAKDPGIVSALRTRALQPQPWITRLAHDLIGERIGSLVDAYCSDVDFFYLSGGTAGSQVMDVKLAVCLGIQQGLDQRSEVGVSVGDIHRFFDHIPQRDARVDISKLWKFGKFGSL